MVYIASSGTIRESPPLLNRLSSFLWGILNFIVLFFQTMIPGLNSGFGSSITNGSFRGSDGGDGGGGGGSGGSRGSGNRPTNPKAFPPWPRPSRRNVRGFGTMSDIPPPPACGGCGCG